MAEAKAEQLQQALDEARTRARASERQQGGARGAASGSGTAGYDNATRRLAALGLVLCALPCMSRPSQQAPNAPCLHKPCSGPYTTLLHDNLPLRAAKVGSLAPPDPDSVLCAHRSSAQTRLLEQELSAVRDEAAAATAHTKQFQTLATSSDQALRDMEVSRHAPMTSLFTICCHSNGYHVLLCASHSHRIQADLRCLLCGRHAILSQIPIMRQ